MAHKLRVGMLTIAVICIPLFSVSILTASGCGWNWKYFPSDDWKATSPELQGMNSTVIEGMYDFIANKKLNLQSVLIVRNGFIIEEEYLFNYARVPSDIFMAPYDDYYYDQIHDDRLHAAWSVTKSVTSLLIGIAINKGFIDSVDQTFFEIFPDKWNPMYYNETKKDISIEDLLTQTSGLQWNELVDGFAIWPAYGYSLFYILNKTLVAEPSTVFNYNTGNSELLAAILQERTGMKTSEFARKYLFEPIGLQATEWEWLESPWPWGSGPVANISHGGFGIYMTPQAMARIGLLCLNNGNWAGRQVVPAAWITTSTQPHVTEGIFDPTKDYGYLWWISPNYYCALGLFGQRIIVIPEYDIVVVFTAEISAIVVPEMDYIINTYIIGAVIPPPWHLPWLWH